MRRDKKFLLISLILIVGITATTATSRLVTNPVWFDNTTYNQIYWDNTSKVMYINNEDNVTISKNNMTEYQTLKAGQIYSNNNQILPHTWTNTTTTTTTSQDVTITGNLRAQNAEAGYTNRAQLDIIDAVGGTALAIIRSNTSYTYITPPGGTPYATKLYTRTTLTQGWLDSSLSGTGLSLGDTIFGSNIQLPVLFIDADNSRVGINVNTTTQALTVGGSINVSGTVYYGALVANSPHAMLKDEAGYTRICMTATDGTTVMQTIENKAGTYTPTYTPNHPDCLNKEITKDITTVEDTKTNEYVTTTTYYKPFTGTTRTVTTKTPIPPPTSENTP